MDFCKQDCLAALPKVHENQEAYRMIELLIHKHFLMVDHMKKTSLFDVYEYEKKATEAVVEPMRILAFENERMKKEINELRSKRGLSKKYK